MLTAPRLQLPLISFKTSYDCCLRHSTPSIPPPPSPTLHTPPFFAPDSENLLPTPISARWDRVAPFLNNYFCSIQQGHYSYIMQTVPICKCSSRLLGGFSSVKKKKKHLTDSLPNTVFFLLKANVSRQQLLCSVVQQQINGAASSHVSNYFQVLLLKQ